MSSSKFPQDTMIYRSKDKMLEFLDIVRVELMDILKFVCKMTSSDSNIGLDGVWSVNKDLDNIQMITDRARGWRTPELSDSELRENVQKYDLYARQRLNYDRILNKLLGDDIQIVGGSKVPTQPMDTQPIAITENHEEVVTVKHTTSKQTAPVLDKDDDDSDSSDDDNEPTQELVDYWRDCQSTPNDRIHSITSNLIGGQKRSREDDDDSDSDKDDGKESCSFRPPTPDSPYMEYVLNDLPPSMHDSVGDHNSDSNRMDHSDDRSGSDDDDSDDVIWMRRAKKHPRRIEIKAGEFEDICDEIITLIESFKEQMQAIKDELFKKSL